MAEVELIGVDKTFPNGFCALRDLSLRASDGELLVLVGPSGCGKSTVLNLVAGLESCTAGTIRIGDRDVTEEPSKRRDVAMVFQDYALYPHLSVARNIGFPLELARMPKAEIRQRVAEVAAVLGLTGQLDRKPGQLSGGQKQRVAMGRAIVRRPSVFLMDEPLSNLDALLRVQMRSEIARLQHELGVTTIYVTHDQVEAMTMGERVAVMLDGRLQQLAPPQAMYAEPANVFVAGFIGSPPMNLLRGRLIDGGGPSVELGSSRLALDAALLDRVPMLRGRVGRDVVVGFRPEHVELSGDGPGLDGRVVVVEALGAELLAHVEVAAAPVRIADVVADVRAREELGGELVSRRDGERTAAVVARLPPDALVAKGGSMRLSIDPARLHLFDPDTGDRFTDG